MSLYKQPQGRSEDSLNWSPENNLWKRPEGSLKWQLEGLYMTSKEAWMYFGGRLEGRLSGHLESSRYSRFEITLYGSLILFNWTLKIICKDALKGLQGVFLGRFWGTISALVVILIDLKDYQRLNRVFLKISSKDFPFLIRRILKTILKVLSELELLIF